MTFFVENIMSFLPSQPTLEVISFSILENVVDDDHREYHSPQVHVIEYQQEIQGLDIDTHIVLLSTYSQLTRYDR